MVEPLHCGSAAHVTVLVTRGGYDFVTHIIAISCTVAGIDELRVARLSHPVCPGAGPTAGPYFCTLMRGWITIMRSFHRNLGLMAALAVLSAGCGDGNGGNPPGNEDPVAAFTFNCNALACTFTDGSTETDGTSDN
jgi:hypothetical protein